MSDKAKLSLTLRLRVSDRAFDMLEREAAKLKEDASSVVARLLEDWAAKRQHSASLGGVKAKRWSASQDGPID